MADPDDPTEPASPLAGPWTRVGGDDAFPDHLEFSVGTYLGTRGAGQGFVVWDAGIYRVEGPDRVRIQGASDEVVEYQWSQTGDQVRFVDPGGRQVTYRRAAAASQPQLDTEQLDIEEKP